MKNIEVYTDGSCNNATKNAGGYGIVIKVDKDNPVYISGGRYDDTTSNRMELLAIIRSIELIHSKYKNDRVRVKLHTDSAYCLNSIVRGWAKGWSSQKDFAGKANEDLWRRCLSALDDIGERNVELIKVKGHSGIHFNEIADQMASRGGSKELIN